MSDDDKSLDLTGLGKVADSELANKAYDDALAPLMNQLGKLGEDVAKTGRLLLSPLQILAAHQDRLGRWVQRIADDVPPPHRQPPPPEIVGPVLRNLSFMEEENEVAQLYLELLKRSMDKQRCDEAHPAFIKIIEQVSRDEALMLYDLEQLALRHQSAVWFISDPTSRMGVIVCHQGTDQLYDPSRLRFADRVFLYFGHLVALGIFHGPPKPRFSDFGRMFVEACVPKVFVAP